MASEERTWPRWVRLALRVAIVAIFATTGFITHDRDTPSRADLGAPDGYTADFPLKLRALLHPGVDVYYFHDSVGHVISTSPEGDKLVVRVVIDPDFKSQMQAMDSTFEAYRDHKHPSEGWIAVIPKRADGTPMTPREAERVWGRGPGS